MTIVRVLFRCSGFRLFLPVAVLCWCSCAHGGLTVGLLDEDADHLQCRLAETCIPESQGEEESRVEDVNGHMDCCSFSETSSVEQIAVISNSPRLDSFGARMEWDRTRVSSSYVKPPPLIVPIIQIN